MSLTRRTLLAASTPAIAGCQGVLDRSSDSPPRERTPAETRLGFVGDVMLGRNVDSTNDHRAPGAVWDGTLERLQSLDGLFLNLECCLSERGQRRPGRTYHFRADPDWAVPALEAAGVTWAGLANNHLLDYGPVALADTTANLDSGGVAHAGAGETLAAAIRPAQVRVGEFEVAAFALTDQSPSYAAAPGRPGTAFAPLSRHDSYTRWLVEVALERVRASDPDLVVASLHWGPNWVVTPAPRQRAFARWLVDRGVDVVHGHSAHVVQGVEIYRGRPILYDTGDFVDDYLIKPGLHNDRSFLFELHVEEGSPETLRLVPVEIEAEAVHPANDAAASWLRQRMRRLSRPFGTTFERDGSDLVVSMRGCPP